MIFDEGMIRKVYENFPQNTARAKEALKRPLTLCEKILYAHLSDKDSIRDFKRAVDYVDYDLADA